MDDQISDIKIPTIEEQEVITQGLENIKIFAEYNLEQQYNFAQIVECISNVKFFWSLRGQEYSLVKGKLSEAMHFEKGVYLVFTSTLGEKFYTENMPYLLLRNFINTVDEISTKNHRIKLYALQKIKSTSTVDELLILCQEMNLHTSKQIRVPDMQNTIYITNSVVNINQLIKELYDSINKDINNKLADEYITQFITWYNTVTQEDGSFTILNCIDR